MSGSGGDISVSCEDNFSSVYLYDFRGDISVFVVKSAFLFCSSLAHLFIAVKFAPDSGAYKPVIFVKFAFLQCCLFSLFI